MRRADLAIQAAAIQSGSSIQSVDDLVDWLMARGNEQYAISLDHKAIAKEVKLPPDLVRSIIYSPAFISSLHRYMLAQHFSPGRLAEIFQSIYVQLLSQDVPLGAKRSMLEWVVRQLGVEEPRRVAISAEVVVSLDGNIAPEEVFRELGIRVDQATHRSLPQETGKTIEADFTPLPSADGLPSAPQPGPAFAGGVDKEEE